MPIGRFLIFVAIGTLLSWVTWILTIVRMDPQSGGALAVTLFFGSLFFAVVGSGTLVGYAGRHWLERDGVPYRQMTVATRQAVGISVLVIALLGLQAARILNVWTFVLAVGIVIGVEGFFIAGQSRHHVDASIR